MFDKLKDDPKLQVIVIIAGTTIVISVAILILIILWIPNNNKDKYEEEKLKTGEYNTINIDTKGVLEKYAVDINNILNGADDKYISDSIDKEYMKFIGFNENNIVSYLNKKGVLHKLLKFGDYSVVDNERHGKVFSVDIETYDNTFKDKMFIIEKYPNDYKLSFDNFIGFTSKKKTSTVEGITLEVHNIKEVANKITINTTIINNTGKNLIINSKNMSEPIYTNNGIKMCSDFFKGKKLELLPDQKFDIKMEFNTEYLQTGYITDIVIKDVYNSVSDETKEYKFKI